MGGNSSVAIFDLDFGGKAEPMSMCVKLMPEESLVPKWLLKRFWKAEIFYYNKMKGGFPQPQCYFAAFEADQAVVVMNEMTKSHLDPGDSTRDLTHSEACRSLMVLAKFHARWWGAQVSGVFYVLSLETNSGLAVETFNTTTHFLSSLALLVTGQDAQRSGQV